MLNQTRDAAKDGALTMRRPTSMRGLEDLGRVRLSQHFFLRDFLFSEIAAIYGIQNIPDDPDLAIAAGTRLCEDLLEPLWRTFGGINIRSGFRGGCTPPCRTITCCSSRNSPPST